MMKLSIECPRSDKTNNRYGTSKVNSADLTLGPL